MSEQEDLAEEIRAIRTNWGASNWVAFDGLLARDILVSPWLRAHDDRIRAEALAAALALADECERLNAYLSHDVTDLTSPMGWRGVNRPAWEVIRTAAALRAAAGTPTHHTTGEERMSETEEDCGGRQRNGHTIELRGCMWRCRQCDHIFDAAVDADLFWCGEDCTGKHPGDTLTPAPTPDDAEGKG